VPANRSARALDTAKQETSNRFSQRSADVVAGIDAIWGQLPHLPDEAMVAMIATAGHLLKGLRSRRHRLLLQIVCIALILKILHRRGQSQAELPSLVDQGSASQTGRLILASTRKVPLVLANHLEGRALAAQEEFSDRLAERAAHVLTTRNAIGGQLLGQTHEAT